MIIFVPLQVSGAGFFVQAFAADLEIGFARNIFVGMLHF